ncbi:MAG: hypothetical protein WBY44_23030 [Bryobacteraceae bacterium]
MKQRLSDRLPVRAMRIGVHGRKRAVKDVDLIFIDERRRVMRFRFVDPAGRSTDLQMTRHTAWRLFEWAFDKATTP